MSPELVKALMAILKVCIDTNDCRECLLKDFCKKMPSEW